MKNTRATLSLAALAASMALLAACSRNDDRSVGQTVDQGIERAEHAAESAADKVGSAADRLARAGDAVADKAGDAAITAGVNAELAKDRGLSALRIDVDTAGGRVVLRGSAPDAAAKDRATQLAQSVQGVVAVDNQLRVGG